MILFVGDRPSKKNVDQEVAFIGTQSGKVLQEWILKMKLTGDIFLTNSHTDLLVRSVDVHHNLGTAIVVLGNVASKRLQKAGIPHFKLPHPSGRNRKLNNKKFIDSELEKCKNYLKRKGHV